MLLAILAVVSTARWVSRHIYPDIGIFTVILAGIFTVILVSIFTVGISRYLIGIFKLVSASIFIRISIYQEVYGQQ